MRARCSGIDARRAAPAQLLRRRARPRPTASRCATPSGSQRIWDAGRCETGDVDAAAGARSPRSTPRTSTPSAALAITPVKFGISFNLTAFNQAGALVHVYKDGSVLVNHGGTEMGQGLHTKMLQVAATALGRAAVERCGSRRPAPTRCPTPRPPRPARAPTSTAARSRTPASRSATGWPRSPPAARRRTRTTCGSSTASSPGSGSTTGELDVRRARARRLLPAGPAVGGRLLPHRGPALGRHARCRARRSSTSPTASRRAEVEVDGFTGAYRLRRVDIVHDVGDSLSPLIDLGQVEGGFVQGAGWLTLEDLRWDDSDGPHRGRLATQAASTYKLPSFSEMPEDFNVHAARAGHRGRRRLRLQGRRRAAADAGLQRARGAARRRRRVRARRATASSSASPGDAGGGVLGGRGGPGGRRPAAGPTARPSPRRGPALAGRA